LLRVVNEINNNNEIAFILIGGDVTENGDSASLCKAKQLLNQLKKPYYITFGNHDVRASKSENRFYTSIFGSDRFSFSYKDVHFIGFSTVPVSNYGAGHVSTQDITWIKTELSQQKPEKPLIVTTHYPLLTGDVDNWYEMTDILRKYNIQVVLNGHYHRNALLNYDGIAGIVNRSTLRGKEPKGGYSIYTVSDSLSVSEKLIDSDEREWLTIPIEKRLYEAPDQSLRK
jgi:predicted MPP superfamily phosphohydrolase